MRRPYVAGESGEEFRPGWVPSRQQLLDALERGADVLPDVCARLSGDEWEVSKYESGWNARQLLAHISSMEWTYPLLVKLAQATKAGVSDGRASMQGGNDAYNARQVQKRASASIDELLAEFARNRQATIEAVRDAEPDLWDVRIESAGGLRGPLARVLWLASIEHVNQHVRDLLSQDVPRTPVVTELSSADDSGI